MNIDDTLLTELLSALGAHLERNNCPITIIVVGGASLTAYGLIDRTTKDVNVIARVEIVDGEKRLVRATPFPSAFVEAVSRVSRDYNLQSDWLNAVIDKQWEFGLPPDFEEDISWNSFGVLNVGFVGRSGLIPLKLFAAIDQGPTSKHWQDLLALEPTQVEINKAADWVRSQDIGTEFKTFDGQAIEQLRTDLAKHKPNR
ncbi:MAG: hypothetical protein IH951_12685 [Bacteroidetes bacterium]|nr:hypothetical protein [Bacteroidota bacterium]